MCLCVYSCVGGRGFGGVGVCVCRRLSIYPPLHTHAYTHTQLVIPDVAHALVWCDEYICIGFRREYNMVHITSGTNNELFPTGVCLFVFVCAQERSGGERERGSDTVCVHA